jgi:hypothetical protein
MCAARVRGSETIVGERPPASTPYIGQEGDSLVVVFEDNDFLIEHYVVAKFL